MIQHNARTRLRAGATWRHSTLFALTLLAGCSGSEVRECLTNIQPGPPTHITATDVNGVALCGWSYAIACSGKGSPPSDSPSGTVVGCEYELRLHGEYAPTCTVTVSKKGYEAATATFAYTENPNGGSDGCGEIFGPGPVTVKLKPSPLEVGGTSPLGAAAPGGTTTSAAPFDSFGRTIRLMVMRLRPLSQPMLTSGEQHGLREVRLWVLTSPRSSRTVLEVALSQ